MEIEPGEGWSDAVSKILRMGKNNPKNNRILSKAKKDNHSDESDTDASGNDSSDDNKKDTNKFSEYKTSRLKPRLQPDALQENELNAIATRGVVHLFNAVKTVNPKSDKKRKKKKKKKSKKNGIRRKR